MKTVKIILLNLMTYGCFAKTPTFASSQDLSANNIHSNIAIQNTGNQPITVYGLYIKHLSYVRPGQSCASSTPIYPSPSLSTENRAVGAFVSPVTIPAHTSAEIGANYLYNMLLGANYYVYVNISSSPPGCAIPGCTWGSDTDIFHWCIKIGILGPKNLTSSYSDTNVPPVAALVSDTGYNFNLATDYQVIGPIHCNDRKLDCQATNLQVQPISANG